MSLSHPSAPTAHHLVLNGKRIAYTAEGAGVAVVALHGYPGSATGLEPACPLPHLRAPTHDDDGGHVGPAAPQARL